MIHYESRLGRYPLEDPDGGTIVLHGVLPTVVLPNAMRPRFTWHGLGIMGSSEEIEVWMEKKKQRLKILAST